MEANRDDGACRFWIVMDYKGRDHFVGKVYPSVNRALSREGIAQLCGRALIRFKTGSAQPNFPGLTRKSKPKDRHCYMWVFGYYGGETRAVCYKFTSANYVLKEKQFAQIAKAVLKAFKKSDKTIQERKKESEKKEIDRIVFDTDKDGNIWEVKDEKKKQEILDPSLGKNTIVNPGLN